MIILGNMLLTYLGTLATFKIKTSEGTLPYHPSCIHNTFQGYVIHSRIIHTTIRAGYGQEYA